MATRAETIFALSTAAGRAAIAVVRVSGPGAGPALEALTGRARPKPRYASLRRLRDPDSGEAIDDGLVLWFPGPGSETGEDMAEFQIHGGRATVAALLAALARLPGLRLARPGEFTRRAFENGKLDLTAVEGLADLIEAETEAQRRQAERQMRGELGRLYETWRAGLMGIHAQAEAAIEFPDEAAEQGFGQKIASQVTALSAEIARHLDDGARGERLRVGLSVAILGAPNVGKSSLLNALSKREAAIVSARAGTTRDVVEVQLDLGGYPVLLADTAGIRDSGDEIEIEGVRRAKMRAENADVRVIVLDAQTWPEVPAEVRALACHDALIVLNKVDLTRPANAESFEGKQVLKLSARTGEGVGELLAALEREAVARMGFAEAPGVTRARHRESLERCRAALARSAEATLPELIAEDLRLAARELGRITGRVGVEDLLDAIFKDFCIGK
ncbi:MAG TPA: tRNA uridine-5-carboxymethylaminomethyl(34) synthesis GTPase MnmE [Alphaproteobacteria bacterium]|nr:tRNA uridine-5-carboxymethylaminomethyl(34) synthesis GTPase MnmE [Alphaproteobacteria bacterium]